MIDEIYLSKRVETSGGQVFDLTADCNTAATALCFMIKMNIKIWLQCIQSKIEERKFRKLVLIKL